MGAMRSGGKFRKRMKKDRCCCDLENKASVLRTNDQNSEQALPAKHFIESSGKTQVRSFTTATPKGSTCAGVYVDLKGGKVFAIKSKIW